jgi:hypothetical protein
MMMFSKLVDHVLSVSLSFQQPLYRALCLILCLVAAHKVHQAFMLHGSKYTQTSEKLLSAPLHSHIDVAK